MESIIKKSWKISCHNPEQLKSIRLARAPIVRAERIYAPCQVPRKLEGITMIGLRKIVVRLFEYITTNRFYDVQSSLRLTLSTAKD